MPCFIDIFTTLRNRRLLSETAIISFGYCRSLVRIQLPRPKIPLNLLHFSGAMVCAFLSAGSRLACFDARCRREDTEDVVEPPQGTRSTRRARR
jgi:hypothetical protein